MEMLPSLVSSLILQPENAFTIAVSTGLLFNMEKEQQIYEQQGLEAWIRSKVEYKTVAFSPGTAFSFVKALAMVNARLRELYPDSEEVFDIVLVRDDEPFVEPFSMTGGNSLIGFLRDHHTNLYLSADPTQVKEVLEEGIAAATMFAPEKIQEVSGTQLRVAFDGDGVLFSDESERVFKTKGLDKFLENEQANEEVPLNHGPLKCFLEALGKLQKKFYAKGLRMDDCPIRTYLVTARAPGSSGNRALNTLRSWGLEIDEPLLLTGAPKGPVLEKISPHIFFDDQMPHVEGAAGVGIVACHVPYGVAQE